MEMQCSLYALAAIAGALTLATGQAQAIGRLADVRVLDRSTGAELPIHHAAGRYWVAGTPGRQYAIVVNNRTGERVLAVMSVDGVNAVSGETAAWNQTGYVLAPSQRYEVRGWRKSDAEIAAFEFASLGESYAARTGRPANVGVIGVAVFRELPQPESDPAYAPAPQPRAEPARKSAAGSADEASASERGDAPGAERRESAKLGTGHGARESSWVAHTAFERAREQPDEVIAIHYDSRANLIAMGVIPAPRRPPLPNPFPAAELGYVPDPPARR